MTSKSASAAFADGIAFNSRSRAVSAALAAAENPRMRAVEEVGPCADSHATPTVAAHTAAIAPGTGHHDLP